MVRLRSTGTVEVAPQSYRDTHPVRKKREQGLGHPNKFGTLFRAIRFKARLALPCGA